MFGQLDDENCPRLTKVWAHTYHNHNLRRWLAEQRPEWELEVILGPEEARGFVRLPKRWVVERTFAWRGRYRRLSKDYERRTDWSASMVRLGAIHLMLRRLAKPAMKDPPFCYRQVA